MALFRPVTCVYGMHMAEQRAARPECKKRRRRAWRRDGEKERKKKICMCIAATLPLFHSVAKRKMTLQNDRKLQQQYESTIDEFGEGRLTLREDKAGCVGKARCSSGGGLLILITLRTLAGRFEACWGTMLVCKKHNLCAMLLFKMCLHSNQNELF